MERSITAHDRLARVRRLGTLAAKLPSDFAADIIALRSQHTSRMSEDAAAYFDEDLRATIIAASTILAAAQAALSLRRGGDGTTVEVGPAPKPRPNGAGANYHDQREITPAERAGLVL